MAGVREDWFPTSIWYFDVEDHAALDARLLELVARERERDPEGLGERSCMLGWHSAEDLHRRPAWAPFVELVRTNVEEVARFLRWDRARVAPEIVDCWAIVNPRYAANMLHSHPHAVLSGVYWVQAGQKSGDLYFHDPRTAPALVTPPLEAYGPFTWRRAIYRPRPGRMLVFPGWLRHGVEPNLEDGERVCLSFNVRLRFLEGD
jgi:uncharacterized protein (TIGR02466 family)